MDVLRLPSALEATGNLNHNWKIFKQEFNFYMVASEKNKKGKEVQAAIFLNLVGEYGRELFNNFNMATEDTKDVDQVLARFENFCAPKKNLVYERFKLNQRSQQQGETFDSFLTAIQKLIRTCEYGNEEDNILRDRIVIGIGDSKLQEKLLGMEVTDAEKAISLCRAAELAKIQAMEVQQEQRKTPGCIDSISTFHTNKLKNKVENTKVNKTQVKFQNNQAHNFNCFRCDKQHDVNKCPALGKTCNRCGRMNHYAIKCRSNAGSSNRGKVSQVRLAQDSDDDSITDSVYDSLYLGTVKTHGIDSVEEEIFKGKSWYETILIEGSAIKVKVDTGAEANCINLRTFRKLNNNKVKIHKPKRNFDAYGGHEIRAVGMCFLVIERGERKFRQEFYIFDNNDVTLLGLETCELLGFVSRFKDRIDSVTNQLKCKFMNENKDVFEGIGTFKEQCSLKLKDDACPVTKPVRRIPKALYERLKCTLGDLVKRGIIKPIDNEEIEWVHNLVIREKADGNLRVCLDPKDLNANLKPQVHPIPTSEEINSKLVGKKVFSVFDCKEGFYHFKLDEAGCTNETTRTFLLR